MRRLRRIYAMSHLPFSYEVTRNIQPFVLGVDDATGDNIVDKPAFSETRGHYWLWKNLRFRDDEFVAVCQYRRCFFFPQIPELQPEYAELTRHSAKQLGDFVYTLNRADYVRYAQIVDEADLSPVNEWLGEFDLLVNRPGAYPNRMTIAQMYGQHHRATDWEIFASVCRRHGLDDGNHSWITGHLMFVMRPDLFDEYMTLWWAVMQEVDSMVEHETDPYQHRKIGYLTERFLSAWLIKMRIERPKLRIMTALICEGLFQHDRTAPNVM